MSRAAEMDHPLHNQLPMTHAQSRFVGTDPRIPAVLFRYMYPEPAICLYIIMRKKTCFLYP